MRSSLQAQPVSLAEKFALINEHWRPKAVAELNGQEVKLVKFQGVFPWHHHEAEDEMFLVWRGRMAIEFRDRAVELSEGQLCVVPRGTEHRTKAEQEAWALLFEPAGTRNTGNVTDPEFTAPLRNRVSTIIRNSDARRNGGSKRSQVERVAYTPDTRRQWPGCFPLPGCCCLLVLRALCPEFAVFLPARTGRRCRKGRPTKRQRPE